LILLALQMGRGKRLGSSYFIRFHRHTMPLSDFNFTLDFGFA
jgi:hypothetical protein